MQYGLALVILLSFFSTKIVYADIYRQTNDQGNIIYTDTPSTHAIKIETTPTPQSEPTPPETVPLVQATKKNAYQTFAIASPTDQENFHNEHNIKVDLKIDPPLKSGDKIQLFVDSKPWQSLTEKTHIELGHLERGAHQLSASILDSNQVIIQLIQPITIYVHYAALGAQNNS